MSQDVNNNGNVTNGNVNDASQWYDSTPTTTPLVVHFALQPTATPILANGSNSAATNAANVPFNTSTRNRDTSLLV
jgi:hypothetical protein